jgi:ferredoxin
MKEMLVIIVSAILVENFVLTKFLGICPFLGVSKSLSSALGMSVAVVFVMTIASGATWVFYPFFQVIRYILSLKYSYIHSIAIGMQTEDEVEMNVRIFEGQNIPDDLKERVKNTRKKLHIDYWCEGCGKCVERCRQKALEIIDGKAVVKKDKCVLCGYCASACPQFAIKIC